MEPGFSPTVFVGIGIAIAVVVNLMYRTEPRSKEADPYFQYGAYRSYGRAVFLTIVEILLLITVGVVSFWHLGWMPTFYLLGPVSSLLGWITWKYFRSTATLPPEIASGLVFLNAHRVHWAPKDLEVVVNGWGIFGGMHTTNIDAGITKNALYLHFDDRLYLVPFGEIESAIPTEIRRLDQSRFQDAIKFGFVGIVPFSISVAWPAEQIGSSIGKIGGCEKQTSFDAA